MIMAISACPATIAEILALADKVSQETLRIDEVIDGFIDTQEEVVVSETVEEEEEEAEEEEEEEEESEEDGEAAAAANLAQLKVDALERFAVISDLFAKLGKAYEKFGYRSKQYDKLQLANFRRTHAVPLLGQASGRPVRNHARTGGRSTRLRA